MPNAGPPLAISAFSQAKLAVWYQFEDFRQKASERRLNMKEVILAREDPVVRNNL
jgi:hypothetical protein